MIKLYVDAATKGNPGPAGIGILIIENKKQQSFKLPLSTMSNHEAEFHAALEGLRKIPLKKRHEPVFLYTDSQVVVDSIQKRTSKNVRFAPLLEKILLLASTYDALEVIWQPDSVKKGAHTLAQQALFQQL